MVIDLPAVYDGETILEVCEGLNHVLAWLSHAVGVFDTAGGFEAYHSTSTKAWLVDKARLDSKFANQLVHDARRLRQLPATRETWCEGKLGHGQVRAVLANVKNETVHRFAEHEPQVVPTLVPLGVTDTARVMMAWRLTAEAACDGSEPADSVDTVHVASTLDGRVHVQGSLSAAKGEVVERALDLARSGDESDRRKVSEQNADALEQICRFFLDHQQTRLGGRHRPHVNVIIDVHKLETAQGELWNGTPLARTDVGRVLCDTAIHRVITKGRSTVLDYGAATRTIPAPLFNALVIRDRHCRFPGCERPAKWCEAHHVIPWWPNRGPTRLDNLVLLCSRHHHLCHHDWQLTLHTDATLELRPPDGTPLLQSHPPPCTNRLGESDAAALAHLETVSTTPSPFTERPHRRPVTVHRPE